MLASSKYIGRPSMARKSPLPSSMNLRQEIKDHDSNEPLLRRLRPTIYMFELQDCEHWTRQTSSTVGRVIIYLLNRITLNTPRPLTRLIASFSMGSGYDYYVQAGYMVRRCLPVNAEHLENIILAGHFLHSKQDTMVSSMTEWYLFDQSPRNQPQHALKYRVNSLKRESHLLLGLGPQTGFLGFGLCSPFSNLCVGLPLYGCHLSLALLLYRCHLLQCVLLDLVVTGLL